MIPIIRNVIIIFLILSVIYVILTIVARIRQRDKLTADYDEEERSISKADFIADGLDEHNKKTRRKLMLRVYIIPFIIALILLWLAHTGA